MSDISLSKIKKITGMLGGICFVLAFAGFSDRIFKSTKNAILFFGFFVLLALFGFIYFLRLHKKMEKSKKSFGLIFFRTVHKYRYLMEQLISRDFKVKYKRSILGVFWSFLNPLLMMLVQYVVFTNLFHIRGNIEHYAIYLLSGIVIWNGFNDSVTQSMRSITGNAQLITKVYVPKYIYPVTKVFSSSVNMLLSMIPLLLVTVIYGLFSSPSLYLRLSIFLLPFVLVLIIIFAMGIGFILSSLMVFFHDIEFLWTVFASIWMYGTPIIYDISMLSSAPWLVAILKWNPLYHYVDFVRTILIAGASPSLHEFGVCVLASLLSFGIGALVFKKCQDKFILYL